MKYSFLFSTLLWLVTQVPAQITPILTVPRGHKSIVRNCYFTPNDKYLISTDDDHMLCIWDGDDGRQIFTLRDSTASFSKVEMNQASTFITALTGSGRLYFIELSSLKVKVIQDRVYDFSLNNKDESLYFILDSGSLYSYTHLNQVKRKIALPSSFHPRKVIAISRTEACMEDGSKGIFIINTVSGKLAPVLIAGSTALTLQDFHPEAGYLLCTGRDLRKGSAIFYNIDSRTRSIRSSLAINGRRSTSCRYTSDPTVFIASLVIVDTSLGEEIYVPEAPVVYSFKTRQKISDWGSEILLDVKDINMTFSRKNAVIENNIGYSWQQFQRYDFVSNTKTSVLRRERVPDMSPKFACANLSRKIAVFDNNILLPLIFPAGTIITAELTGIPKYSDLKIHFGADTTASQKISGKRISFLTVNETALNDSVVFANQVYNLQKNAFDIGVYYMKRGQVEDSFHISFDHFANPSHGANRLFWSKGNRFYTWDIAARHISDSIVFPSRVIIQGLKQEGNEVLILREDSLADPKYGTLRYNIPRQKITDTGFVEADVFINRYEEINYSHLTQGNFFMNMTTIDHDFIQNTLFEYPFRYGAIDSIMEYDSLGEGTPKAIQRDPYLRFTTGLKTPDPRTRDISMKFDHAQIQQVRYWDRDCYVVLGRQNKIFLYSARLDSVIRVLDCVSDESSWLFILNNKKVAVSNKNRNDCYIIDIEAGRTLAHLDGFIHPSVHQPGGFLLLQDASLGNYNVYNENDYHFISSVTAFSKTDYVVTTSTGLFDGTEKAIENLYFRINDPSDKAKPWKTIDLSQLKAKYYIPGLWDKLMSGDSTDLPDVESIRKISMAPEIITDSSYSFTRPYKIKLVDKGGGIGAVRVVVNGKEIIADARENTGSSGKQLSLSVDLSPFKDYFKEDNNTIQVFSSNTDSSLISRGSITTSAKNATRQANPRLFVFSIGTSNYKGSDIDLQYSSKDAADMAAALKAGARDLFSADSTFTYLLVSDAVDSSMLPSKINIERVFKELSKKASAKDIVVLYLSGHGINAGGDFCYLTKDAYTANSSAYAFKEVLQAVTITSKEFTEYFRKIKALKQLFIIDACASGKVVENLIAHRDIPYSTLKALDRLKDRTGTHIITGCAADAVSYEASKYGQGLLTYSLLEGMKGASLRENKFLDVMQWFQYARERVPQLADGLGGIQTPQVYSPSGNQSFDIALLDEERKKQIPLAAEKPVFVKSIFQDEERFADHLQVGRSLDDLLTERSAARKTHFIFFPVDAFPGAFQVIGRYKKSSDGISAAVKIFKAAAAEPVSSFSVTATDPPSLAAMILGKISELK